MKWLPVIPFLLLPACSEAPPSPELVGLQLSVEDVSCTEAWLRIRSLNSKGTISLVRDGKALMAFSASVADTVVMDEGLGPGRSYTYQASRMRGGIGSGIEVSEPVSVGTLDTTSHNFVWDQPILLGEGGSNGLYDVIIVNDTLTHAVGEIFLRDSIGQIDPIPNNLAIGNGRIWDIRRIAYWYQGSPYYSAIHSILAFGENDIWFGIGNLVHWNGVDFYSVLVPGFVSIANRLWGRSSQDLYLVGNAGLIYHFNGATWQKSECGTTFDLRDITGDISDKPVWVCGYSNDLSQSALLTYDGQSWHTVWTRGGGSTPPYGDLVSSVAVVGRSLYVTSNLGVFRRSITETSADVQRLLSLGSFAYRIRGSSANNIFVVGDYTRIWHYNGLTWKLLNDGVPARPLYGLAVSENLVVAVGADYSTIPARAVIYMGRR